MNDAELEKLIAEYGETSDYKEVQRVLELVDDLTPLLDLIDEIERFTDPEPQTVTTNHTGPLDETELCRYDPLGLG
jgi:hypothetical protein